MGEISCFTTNEGEAKAVRPGHGEGAGLQRRFWQRTMRPVARAGLLCCPRGWRHREPTGKTVHVDSAAMVGWI